MAEPPLLHRGQPCGHRQLVEVHIRVTHGMSARAIAQQADVFSQHHRRLGGQKPCAVSLRIRDPPRARLILRGIAGVLIKQHNSMTMRADVLRRAVHRILQISHDRVDPRRQRLCLARLQRLDQTVERAVAVGRLQHSTLRQQASAHNRRIREIAEGFQMLRTRDRVIGTGRARRVGCAMADRIQHGLIFGHRMNDAARIACALKAQRHMRGNIAQISGAVVPFEKLTGKGAHVDRSVLA
jgi:hypothetical protein